MKPADEWLGRCAGASAASGPQGRKAGENPLPTRVGVCIIARLLMGLGGDWNACEEEISRQEKDQEGDQDSREPEEDGRAQETEEGGRQEGSAQSEQEESSRQEKGQKGRQKKSPGEEEGEQEVCCEKTQQEEGTREEEGQKGRQKKAPAKKAAKKAASRKRTTAKAKPAARKTAAAKKKPVTRKRTRRPASARRRPARPAGRSVLSGPLHGFEPYQPGKGEEYMSDDQLEHFRDILTAWKLELMEEVDRTVLHMKDEAANFPDPNDRATQESEFGLELRTRDRERKLLKKIDSALARIDDGSYGFCEETGEEIGLKRLEARPVATMCLEAQERRELAERQFRDREDRYR